MDEERKLLLKAIVKSLSYAEYGRTRSRHARKKERFPVSEITVDVKRIIDQIGSHK